MRFIRNIKDDEGNNYMTRIYLSPRTRWGRLVLHIIHCPDADRDPHDHPWDFWTLPLSWGGYHEIVMPLSGNGELETRFVPPYRIHYRRAEESHRIISFKNRFLVTLVFLGKRRRDWGFWTPTWFVLKKGLTIQDRIGFRCLVHWREYLSVGGRKGNK